MTPLFALALKTAFFEVQNLGMETLTPSMEGPMMVRVGNDVIFQGSEGDRQTPNSPELLDLETCSQRPVGWQPNSSDV